MSWVNSQQYIHLTRHLKVRGTNKYDKYKYMLLLRSCFTPTPAIIIIIIISHISIIIIVVIVIIMLPCVSLSSVTGLPLRLQKMNDLEEEEDGAESLISSCVSMRSDRSKNDPPYFSNEPGPSDTK